MASTTKIQIELKPDSQHPTKYKKILQKFLNIKENDLNTTNKDPAEKKNYWNKIKIIKL